MPHHPTTVPDLISFWDFHEPAGMPRTAVGPGAYGLLEAGGPVPRIDEGVFGPHAARLVPGTWLHIPRGDFPLLDLHGPQAQVTVVAWVRFASHRLYQAIAGVWNESARQRQYCLFFNITSRYDSVANVHGHVSDVGGPTPGHPFCITYATGATPVSLGSWHCLGFTYDGRYSRAYLDGRLDANPRPDPFQPGEILNPYRAPALLYDGGRGGAEFTVGAVDRSGEIGNFFDGDLGGLAVWNRALSDQEMAGLA